MTLTKQVGTIPPEPFPWATTIRCTLLAAFVFCKIMDCHMIEKRQAEIDGRIEAANRKIELALEGREARSLSCTSGQQLGWLGDRWVCMDVGTSWSVGAIGIANGSGLSSASAVTAVQPSVFGEWCSGYQDHDGKGFMWTGTEDCVVDIADGRKTVPTCVVQPYDNLPMASVLSLSEDGHLVLTVFPGGFGRSFDYSCAL